MKKVLLTIISVCLIAASIFGLFAGVSSFSDIMNVKEYKEKDAEEGLESIDTLDAGLDQLQENEGTYLAGVDTYTAGLVSYSEGKSTLSAGYAAYYAGKKQLEEGKAAYAAGKKQIEDNTAAYNEGKATLAKIEPLMPYVDQYVKFRNGTISNLAGFATAQAWFVSVVRPIAANLGLNIPDNVTDLPAYVQQMVADGKAQLKQYEDGLAQLAEAEKTIAAGEAQLKDAEKQLAQGEVDLAAGGNKLADGKKQLNTFEDGCAQVAAGCELLLSQPAYMNDEGNGDKKMCPSVADILKERYGDNFSIWELDDNGEIRVVNGCQYLNLENCRAGAGAEGASRDVHGAVGAAGRRRERDVPSFAHERRGADPRGRGAPELYRVPAAGCAGRARRRAVAARRGQGQRHGSGRHVAQGAAVRHGGALAVSSREQDRLCETMKTCAQVQRDRAAGELEGARPASNQIVRRRKACSSRLSGEAAATGTPVRPQIKKSPESDSGDFLLMLWFTQRSCRPQQERRPARRPERLRERQRRQPDRQRLSANAYKRRRRHTR